MIYHLAIAIGVLAVLAAGWGALQLAAGGRDPRGCPSCPGCAGGCRHRSAAREGDRR